MTIVPHAYLNDPEFNRCYVCDRPENDSNHVVPLEAVAHPSHYGGESNPYEAIKVIEAWDLNFSLGNAVKYICRAGKKKAVADTLIPLPAGHLAALHYVKLQDLKKASKYLEFEIARLERGER